jgi:predicted phage tail component-like protein
MYAFVDTVNSGIVGTNLPTEAMSYNGVYLENEIDGYRTLSVTGRELMESEVTDQEIDGMDGSYYRYKTTPARTITVKYQLRARGSREFRDAFNKMNKLLSGEQVKVIFNDESDKYFIGTKTSNTQVDGGSNNVIGEIEIYCSDPRKYSTTEKEFVAIDGVLNIVNEGTVPVSIDYDVQTTSETGYIGLVSEEGVMQYGKIEELDGETYKQSEWLASIDDFYKCSDDVGGTDVMHPSYGTNGTLAEHTWFDKKFIGLGSAGTKKGNANGGLRTLEIPADSSGDASGAQNFYCWFHLCFYAGLMGQTGEMCINFLTEDDKLICGCNWYKTDAIGNTGHYEIWANGKVLKNLAIYNITFTSSESFLITNGKLRRFKRRSKHKILLLGKILQLLHPRD